VNQDHVEPFRAALRNPDNYSRVAYIRLANSLLAATPVRINGTTYNDYQTLDDLQRNTRTPNAVRQQIAAALRNIREQLASRVVDNGLMTQHLRELQRFRQEVARNNPTMTQAQLEAWLFPELLLASRYGGGLRGNMMATAAAGAKGAAGGAMIAVVVQGGLVFWERPPDATQQLMNAGLAGGASGLVGGASERFLTANVGSSLARNLVSRGSSPWLATGVGRGLGRVAGGGVGAPVFAMGMMLLDDQEHSGTDYTATGTRALVSGSLSAALATAVTAAVAGSVAPGVGTVIGFIVGFGAYYAVDSLAGDQVEQGVRTILR
jgi:hypothetical protein